MKKLYDYITSSVTRQLFFTFIVLALVPLVTLQLVTTFTYTNTSRRMLSASAQGEVQWALDSMERHLPSTLEAPSNAAAINRQTDAILSAVSGRDSGGDPIQIYVDRLEVRKDSDISRIAWELYCLTEREKRSRGGGVL